MTEPMRSIVGRAIYEDGKKQTGWHDLTEEEREPWLQHADRAIIAYEAQSEEIGGGKPGSHRWEVVTAVFGWTAAFALSGWLLATIFGASDAGKLLFSIFTGAIAIVLKRDIIRVLFGGK